MWHHYRALCPQLLLGALVVFTPLSLVDEIVERLSVSGGHVTAARIAEAIALAVFGTLFSLFGGIIYAGVVSVLVHHHRGLHRDPLPAVLRSLSYARLAAADLLYALIVLFGFVALLVPGPVFLTWFALVAPAVELEKRPVRDALRRSRALVRPHFWKVFVVIVPLTLLSDVVANLALDSVIALFGEGFAVDWAGNLLGKLIVAPVLALAVVVAFLELRAASKAAG